MYKKRFTKWGMQKNSRRSVSSKTTSTKTLSKKFSQFGDLGSVPISPKSGNDDSLMLMFLTNVRSWSVSFYESVQSNNEDWASSRQSWPEQSHEMNFTFKLVVDMLNRGHGSLAGRVARKAFLLTEEMLMIAGPALMWNMLEIMHYMVGSGQLQLSQLLLAHLVALADVRMPKNHPLPAMLRALRVLAASLPNSMSTSGNSSPTSSWSPPLLDGKEATATATAQSWLFPGAFSYIVERAWTLNAEILFDHFDDRLFQLYLRIHWDSCSIEPPTAIIGAAKKWLANITSQQISSTTAKANEPERFIELAPFEEDRLVQRVFATPMDASPPQNFELLRVSSIAALRNHASSILGEGAGFAGDTNTLLRILAGLVTVKILEERPTDTDLPDTKITGNLTSRISRGQAGNVACAVRTSMDFNAGYDGHEACPDKVARMQSIVALRDYEYANNGTDPRAIREMWLLEDALVAAGEHQKAWEVKQRAYRRLEMYIQDIPVHSV